MTDKAKSDSFWINEEKIDELGVVNSSLTGQPLYPIAADMLHKLKKVGILVRDRRLERAQQKLNRIRNLTIGRQRIYELDRLAMELEVEADLLVQEYNFEVDPIVGADHVNTSGVDRVLAMKRFNQLTADALYLRRLEYDLVSVNSVVHEHTSRDGKYDPENWRGERP